MCGLTGPRERGAVRALIELTKDADETVRDWATYGLGRVGNVNSPAIRAALWERVDDSDPIVRAEALAGLAKRKAKGIVEALTTELRMDDVYDLVIETVGDLTNPQLLPSLTDLRGRYVDNTQFSLEQLDDAIKRCTKWSN